MAVFGDTPRAISRMSLRSLFVRLRAAAQRRRYEQTTAAGLIASVYNQRLDLLTFVARSFGHKGTLPEPVTVEQLIGGERVATPEETMEAFRARERVRYRDRVRRLLDMHAVGIERHVTTRRGQERRYLAEAVQTYSAEGLTRAQADRLRLMRTLLQEAIA